MAIVLAVDGRKRALNAYLRNVNTGIQFNYHLYSNSFVPTDAMVIGDFTESTFPGYAGQSVTSGGWGSPSDDGTCSTVASASQVYTATGASGESAYGYYVTDNADGALLFAELFVGGAVPLSTTGSSVTVIPQYQERTGTPC